MPQKKIVRTTEKRLTNKELDNELSKVNFRNKNNQSVFLHISKQTWFRQYARQSNESKNRIIKKVRHGILHGKYTYMSNKDEAELQGKEKLTPKQKKTSKKQKKAEEKQTQSNKPVKRKIREQIRQTEKTAPSGRKYSKTEIHEGIKSKRAVEWRKKNNISEKDV